MRVDTAIDEVGKYKRFCYKCKNMFYTNFENINWCGCPEGDKRFQKKATAKVKTAKATKPEKAKQIKIIKKSTRKYNKRDRFGRFVKAKSKSKK